MCVHVCFNFHFNSLCGHFVAAAAVVVVVVVIVAYEFSQLLLECVFTYFFKFDFLMLTTKQTERKIEQQQQQNKVVLSGISLLETKTDR